MTHARTAIDTIRGYYYQFDLYALKLLVSIQPLFWRFEQ